MARCPNCTETLQRGVGGDYPPQCPKCGVKIRTKPKKSAVAAAPPSVQSPSSEERIVRSFSTRSEVTSETATPALKQAHANSPVIDETLASLQEETLTANPFVAAPPTNDVSPFSVANEENPFAPPPTRVKESEIKLIAPNNNPFGSSEVAAAPAGAPKTGVVKAVVAGVLVLGIAGVGGWYAKDLLSKPTSKERAGYQNPSRNYVFYSLPSPWKEDAKRANIAGYELALHRADLGGWVTLRSEITKEESLDPKEVAEQVADKWKERISDFKPSGQLAKMDLAKQPAIVVEGEGTINGKVVRGRTLVLAVNGVKYLMGFEGPVDEWDKLERDFSLARENLELTGGSPTPVKMLGENEVAVFESKKFPYRFTTPAGAWREVPDLQTDSRFDDLKLQDKSRLGEVVVTVRETKDLPGMRVRYVERQSRLYENKLRELEGSIEKLSIRGKPAMRTILIISNAGGDFMLHTTFIQGDGLVFQMQCRAPVDKREVYEPIFVKISGSFEVLDKPPTAPSKELPEEKKAEKLKSKAAATTSLTSEKTESKTGQDAMKSTAPTAKQKPAEEEKPPDVKSKKPATEGDKKPDSTKKKKSLDDLD